MTTQKVYNFSAGPAVLPESVMLKAQEEFINYKGIGFGIMESSHRTPVYQDVLDTTEANIRKLMNISDDYAVLFLQGGASLQFAMLPMNLALPGKPIVFANTGAWSNKAIKEAKLLADVDIVYDGKDSNFAHIGDCEEWQIDQNASYMHLCTNNTIFGTEVHNLPNCGDVPLVADMSSDIMSRPIDVSKYGVIFAGAQKNLGPAGVTLVIIRKDLAERVKANTPTMLKYSTFISKQSMFNTPPTFSIYMVGLMAEWLLTQGGLEGIEKINTTKSQSLYEYIDNSGFYRGTADPADRSKMNICFRLPSEDLEKQFVIEAGKNNMVSLKGHRDVGGIRASIYNAMPLAGVECLIDFMEDFKSKNI